MLCDSVHILKQMGYKQNKNQWRNIHILVGQKRDSCPHWSTVEATRDGFATMSDLNSISTLPSVSLNPSNQSWLLIKFYDYIWGISDLEQAR